MRKKRVKWFKEALRELLEGDEVDPLIERHLRKAWNRLPRPVKARYAREGNDLIAWMGGVIEEASARRNMPNYSRPELVFVGVTRFKEYVRRRREWIKRCLNLGPLGCQGAKGAR